MNSAVTEPEITEDEYLTQGGLAELLRVSVRTVQRRARHPHFPEPICLGRCYEWHLVFANSIHHITFGLMSGFPQKTVVFGSPFPQARFKPVGPISDSMRGDGVK